MSARPAMSRLLRYLVVGLLALGATSAGTQAQCQYEATVILVTPRCGITGPPPGTPFGISEAGAIAGRYQQCVASDTEAFTWTAAGGFQTLPRPAASQGAQALAINDAGQIVGGVEMGNLCEAALWQGGEVILLGTMPGGNFSLASAINARGEIVGWWGNSVIGPTHAFVWQDGVMTDLGPTFGTRRSQGMEINELGQVVGWMGTAPQVDARAFIWLDGVVSDLGVVVGGFTAVARAVNNRADVVGDGLLVVRGTTVAHAFIWDGAEMTDLGTLAGTTFSRAIDVNDDGRIVGFCHNAGLAALTPFLWERGVMTNLNDLIPPELNITVSIAWAINNAGQITATESGTGDTVLLTPIAPPIGDMNGDCQTDVADLIILIRAWGQSGSPADLNGDGVVNVLDLIVLLLNFGS